MAKEKLPEVLELVRGDAVLGTIEVTPGEADFPWYSGAFEPTAAFDSVRDLFSRELELLRANTSDDSARWDDWEDVHAELHDPGISLRAPDGTAEYSEILIHIDGAEAWWRGE